MHRIRDQTICYVVIVPQERRKNNDPIQGRSTIMKLCDAISNSLSIVSLIRRLKTRK